ncbi:YhcN/YlaJ family sporulation lipoprotein [Paenibacillus soyae]|uniref:YhcN/YlaJ family sporulation lipoprotein n=1 Tax=Paenibacillus soyae TaxID=2969249 RepID=A0A9X2MU56_9BACL|nr:YhcN/YlaJ family sporulation lipoprotein [Paenibacillus soyae]MCR2807958.1 YhcN/YlaJ family sporulation lipoprotein [Paenibacillus soyae]
MKREISLALSVLLLSTALVSGCGRNDDGNGLDDNQANDNHNEVRQNALMPNNQTPQGGYRATPDDSVRTPGEGANAHSARINADQLADIAEQVPGVERADIAMNTDDVLVGIEVDNVGKRRIIEKQVTSALHWQYPEYRYHVTSDEALRDKIKAAGARKKGIQAQMFNQDIDALAQMIDRETLP